MKHIEMIREAIAHRGEQQLKKTQVEPRSDIMKEFVKAEVVDTRLIDPPIEKAYTAYVIQVEVYGIGEDLPAYAAARSQHAKSRHSFVSLLPCRISNYPIHSAMQTNIAAYGQERFEVLRRYSDFEKLHRHFQSLSIPRLPSMPDKNFFGAFGFVFNPQSFCPRSLSSLFSHSTQTLTIVRFAGRFDDTRIKQRIATFNEILLWASRSSYIRSNREFLLFLKPD